MFPTIDRDTVIECNPALLSHDAAISDAGGTLQEMTSRRAALIVRRDETKAQQPVDPADHDTSMIDMLVADPAAAHPAHDLQDATRRREAFRQDHAEWQTRVGLLDGAIAKLGGDIANQAAVIDDLRQQRIPLWREFVSAAHRHLLGQFHAQFERIASDVLAPLTALASEKIDGRSIVNVYQGRINPRSSMRIDYAIERDGLRGPFDGNEPTTVWHDQSIPLFPVPTDAQGDTGQIELFRASLASISK